MSGDPHPASANAGAAAAAPAIQTAPRLATALLKAKVADSAFFRTSVEQAILDGGGTKIDPAAFIADPSKLLKHLQERLQIGLGEAWFTSSANGGYGDNPGLAALPKEKALAAAPDAATAAANLDTELANLPGQNAIWDPPEERWARACTETFLYTPYGGPGVNYGGVDSDLYNSFTSGGGYPIVAACQQLATLMILSRGFGISDVSTGGLPSLPGLPAVPLPALPVPGIPGVPAPAPPKPAKAPPVTTGCGCTGGTFKLNAFTAHSKTFGKGRGGGKAVADMFKEATTLGTKVTPGTIVVFNPGGPDYNNQSGISGTYHVGAVLRVDTTGSRVQFMDTGVLTGDGGTSKESGTVDQSFATKFGGKHPEHIIGFGYLADAADIASAAKTLLTYKPLGLVRCVVIDTTEKDAPVVRFVSKLVQMRYPYSRLIWSLRNLPVTNLTVLWYVYNPKGTLFQSIAGLPLPTNFKPPALPPVPSVPIGLVGFGGVSLPTLPALPPIAAALLNAGKSEIVPQMVIRGDATGVKFWRKGTHWDDEWDNGTFTSKDKVPPEKIGQDKPKGRNYDAWSDEEGKTTPVMKPLVEKKPDKPSPAVKEYEKVTFDEGEETQNTQLIEIRHPPQLTPNAELEQILFRGTPVVAGAYRKLGGYCDHTDLAGKGYLDPEGTHDEPKGTCADTPTGVPFFDE